MATADSCPVLSLQPVRKVSGSQSGQVGISYEALQYDMDQIALWTRRLCAYVDARETPAPPAPPAPPVDEWTTITLASDFTTTSTSSSVITGMAFAPEANKTYLVEWFLLLRTSVTTTGPRHGVSWPTGLTDGAATWHNPNSNTALAFRAQGAKTTASAASTGLPTTGDSYLGRGDALLVVGGSPSGNFSLILLSETGGVGVTCKAGSVLRYRTL